MPVPLCFALFRLGLPLFVALLLTPPPARAQADDESHKLFQSIEWEVGPCLGRLGDLAQVQVPAGMVFTGREGTKKWMQASHNLYNEDMLGVVVPTDSNAGWWALFENNDVGHVRDDEKDKLDAAAILKSIREGNAQANKERRKRGWNEVEVVGWAKEPFYDEKSHNLTWAVQGRSPKGETVNYNVRLLGRKGYMSADLILSAEELPRAIGSFDSLLAGYTYTQGNRYAEYRKGDKLAAYGLTALVAGGVGAVAAKTGLLAKFWKLLVIAFIAVAGAIRRFFGAIFNRGEDRAPKAPGPPKAPDPSPGPLEPK